MKPVARLDIHSPGRMSRKQRRDVIAWLRAAARRMARYGTSYTRGRFTEHLFD